MGSLAAFLAPPSPQPPIHNLFALPVSPPHMDEVDVARSVRMRSATPRDIPPRTKPKQGASAKPVKNGSDKAHTGYYCGICQSDRPIQVLLPLLVCLSFFFSLYSCLSFLSFSSSLFLSRSIFYCESLSLVLALPTYVHLILPLLAPTPATGLSSLIHNPWPRVYHRCRYRAILTAEQDISRKDNKGVTQLNKKTTGLLRPLSPS